MLYKYLFLFASLTLISGCSSLYPLPVDEEDMANKLTQQRKKYGLDVATNQALAISNMKDYADWYFIKASELKRRLYKQNDTSFGFALAGLIAGVAKSPEGAAAGALLSSGAGIPAERYQITVQASNYEKASDAMHCMYRYLVPLQSQLSLVPEIDFLNDRIYDVRRKLRKAQSNISLATPDLAELEQSLTNIINQQAIIDTETKNAAKNITGASLLVDQATTEKAKSKLTACVAAFAS